MIIIILVLSIIALILSIISFSCWRRLINQLYELKKAYINLWKIIDFVIPKEPNNEVKPEQPNSYKI